MVLNNKFLEFYLVYGIAAFPVMLLIGPGISEVFLISLILITFLKTYINKEMNFYLNKFSLFFLLFYLSILISTLFNFQNFYSSKAGFFYFRIPLFALSIWFILDRFDFFNKRILTILTLFLFIIILDSLFQYYTGINFVGSEISRNRISSFFFDELILGGFLTRIIPIFLLYLVMSDIINEKKISLPYAGLISFLCLIVYLSGERSSFFLLILFFSIVFFSIKYLRNFLILVLIFFIPISIITPYLKGDPETNPATRMFKKSYQQITGKGEEQYEKHKPKLFNKIYIFSHDHHGHYLLSSKIIKDHPIIGTGVRGFRHLCRKKVYILENNDGCSTHPHNTYIQILTSNGLIGFSLVIFSFFYIIRKIFIGRSEINSQREFNKYEVSKILMLSAIFINLWPLIPTGNFFNNWLSMLYFYPIGFYLYFENKYEIKTS